MCVHSTISLDDMGSCFAQILAEPDPACDEPDCAECRLYHARVVWYDGEVIWEEEARHDHPSLAELSLERWERSEEENRKWAAAEWQLD